MSEVEDLKKEINKLKERVGQLEDRERPQQWPVFPPIQPIEPFFPPDYPIGPTTPYIPLDPNFVPDTSAGRFTYIRTWTSDRTTLPEQFDVRN